MTDSTNLVLPYLEGAQAQKHVTVNESLRKLDALVLLAVEDRDLSAPPGSPADGARYIPAATATGAWSGKENTVAHYVDGAWEFYTPREGFAAYVRDEYATYVFNGSAWLRGDRAAHVDVSSNTTLDATHAGRTVRVDASGGARTITLAASPAAGDWVAVEKSDSSSNHVTLKVGSTDVAWLAAQNDAATFAYWGGAWVEVRRKIVPLTEVFTSSGTWTKAPLARTVDVVVIGAGGGGGAGRRGAAGSARSGGQGGSSGVVNTWSFSASALGATETVTLGAGGNGASAQAADSNDGAAGTQGGTTSFGTRLRALGGYGGQGGSSAAVAALNPILSLQGAQGAPAPTAATSGTTPTVVTPAAGPAPGGNGGLITAGDTARDGSAGGIGSTASNTTTAGGTAGTAGGTNHGGAGTAISDTTFQFGGGGGGGGGAHTGGVPGSGGAGGAPGGGGGGGGASVNGNNSGAGGNGARGEVRVTTYF